MSVFDLTISKDSMEDGVKLFARGRVNTNNASELQYEFEMAMNEGQKNIIINMSQVEYLSSTGIRVILKAYREAADAGIKLAIERPSEIVRNVMGIAALNELIIN